MTLLKTFLGYPEPDGGVPFALWFPLEDRAILIAGIINRSAKAIQDLESEQIPPSTDEELLSHMESHGLHPTHPEQTVWWMRYVIDKFEVEPFEEWEIIELLCPNSEQPPFLESGEGIYNPSLANQTAEMVHPETGIFFPLPESVMAEGVKGVSLVVQNDKEIQKTLLEAVVESCADMAMDSEQFPGMRGRWVLALMGLSLIYDGQDQPVSRDIAEHNRRAIMMGATGSQIPFVRVWTMQQLMNSVTMAQLLARETAKE